MMLQPIFEFWSPVERVSVFTPLGIRFWDAACDAQVSDGLEVMACPENMADRCIRAFRTSSGIYAFQGLPGLRALEYPSQESLGAASPPINQSFQIQVRDAQRRFIPIIFNVDAPHQGIFPGALSVSPASSSPPGFYLFSAPTRAVTAGLAAVRAQLVVKGAQAVPAAHAYVQVQDPLNQNWYGLADERGCVAVLFPYPRFTAIPNRFSPISPLTAVDPQRWTVTIRIHHDPAALIFPRASQLPDLRSILKQRQATIWSSLSSPLGQPVNQITVELVFGREVVLQTDSASTLSISSAV